MKPFLLILGFLAAVLIVSQLVMGLLILQGQASMRTAHQHSGYLTVAVTLVYIGLVAGDHHVDTQARSPLNQSIQLISRIGSTVPSEVNRPTRNRARV